MVLPLKTVLPRSASDAERKRRNEIMAKVNRAYETGDLETIEKLIVEFGQDPEAILGDDIGSRMIKAVRRITQLRGVQQKLKKNSPKPESMNCMSYLLPSRKPK